MQNARMGFAPIEFVVLGLSNENEEFVWEESEVGGRPGKSEKRMNIIADSGMENCRWRV